jgi:hypothetical protein
MESNASVQKSGSDEAVYLTYFRYGDPNHQDPYSVSFLMKPHAECHSLDDWMGENGRKLLRKELTKGLDTLVGHVLPKTDSK